MSSPKRSLSKRKCLRVLRKTLRKNARHLKWEFVNGENYNSRSPPWSNYALVGYSNPSMLPANQEVQQYPRNPNCSLLAWPMHRVEASDATFTPSRIRSITPLYLDIFFSLSYRSCTHFPRTLDAFSLLVNHLLLLHQWPLSFLVHLPLLWTGRVERRVLHHWQIFQLVHL